MLTAAILTTATPAQAEKPKSCPQWEATARAAGFRGKDLKRISYIMSRESTCFARAWNKQDPYTGSYGLTQLNGSWRGTFKRAGLIKNSMIELFNPKKNLRAAYWIYQRSGWAPWGTKSSR
jgi:hypothetical protein